MEGGPNNKQEFKLVERWADVASKSQAPYLEKCFQVKKDCKSHLEEQGDTKSNIEDWTFPVSSYIYEKWVLPTVYKLKSLTRSRMTFYIYKNFM